ncbi:MAG: proprotein convertase P-domain-containing protein, partial [Roseiflexaceae bacterium]
LQQHNSVAYISQNSAVDGTLREPTRMRGSCEYGIVPDIIQVQRQQIAPTNVLVSGARYHYTAQANNIAVIDAHSPDTLIQRTIPVSGTIQLLVISSDKDTLVAVSRMTTPINKLIVSTYDIATIPEAPVLLGKLEVPTDSNVIDATMANNDTQLIILTDGTPQQLMNITLTNLSSPIQNLSRDVIAGTRGFALTSSHNVVSLAQGDDGVAFYQIDSDGTLQLAQVLQTSGYVHHVLAKDTYLYVIVDDVPLQNGIEANTPNTLLTYVYIDDETGTLISPMQPLSRYVHTSLSDDLYTVDAYHIRQVIPYFNDDVMVLSALATDEYCDVACQRISILDTTSVTPTLRSETQFRGIAQAIALAKNDVLVLQQGTTNNSAQLTSFQVSDRRWAATACDRASNCSEHAATSGMSSQLVRSAPVQAGAFMLNAMVAYTQTESLDFHFRADAPAGVLTMTLLIDNQPQLSHLPRNVQDDSIPPVSVEHRFTLPTLTTGRHVAQLSYRTADTPDPILSPRYSFIVDTKAPALSIRDSIVGVQHLINDYIEVNVRIVDDSELLSYNIRNALTAAIYPISSTVYTQSTASGVQQIVLASVYVPRGSLSQPLIPIRVDAFDKAGNTVSRRFDIRVDDSAPQLENAQVSANINGNITPLTANSTITPTTTLDLNVNWSRISDISAITLRQLEYHVTTAIRSDAYDSAIPNTALRTPSLTTTEAARIQIGVRTSDSLDNSAVTRLPDVYADSALTPDYTLFDETSPVYRGWLANGCTVLGVDERTIMRYDGQQFATTWDSQAVRFHWQGANWDTDGDLFIYIDSKIGGTVKAFRPDKYTKDLSTQQNDGESFIVLPANLAGRAIAPLGTSQALTDWRTRLFRAQNTRNTSVVEGADYVIYVGDTAHASLWAWNATTNTWELSESRPQYRFDTDNYLDNSDFRLEFGAIDYDPSTPFGVVAYATTESLFMPWASFPPSNPSRNSMYDDKIVVLPFINGYAWPSLSDAVCPRQQASIPSTTQIQATLVSTPSGASMRSVADAFANTEPDAVQMAIDETTPLCALIPDNSWCTTIRELQTTAMAGSSLLAGLRTINVQSQAPVLGNNSVVTYTLRIANTSPVATTTIYGIAQTYGGVWLTTSNNTNVTAGGNYTFHTISDAVLRDYLILQIPPIAANGVYTVTLNGLIDIDKAQSLAEDRIATGDIAKVEIRLTDRNPQGNPLTNRTIEWLNASVRIDTQAPTHVTPTMHQVVRVGNATLRGTVVDESTVRNVEIMYGFNNASLSQRTFCSVDASNQWQCALVIPSGSTSLKYRLRATDRYGLVGLWSSEYTTPVDTDRPAFVFDARTLALTRSTLVGGNRIQISGLITDSTSVGSLTICDESEIACNTVDAAAVTATTQTYTATQTLNTPIDAQPCSALDFSDYTVYPLPQTAPATARVTDITVEVRISHASAQHVELWLRSPSGTRVALVTSTRAAMTNLVAQFGDANTAATTVLQGSIATTASPVRVRPDGALTTLVGESVNGTWAILACNRTASPLGTFVSSSLNITAQSQPRTINSPWEYTLSNTENLDGVVRTYSMWAR